MANLQVLPAVAVPIIIPSSPHIQNEILQAFFRHYDSHAPVVFRGVELFFLIANAGLRGRLPLRMFALTVLLKGLKNPHF